jgi:DNA-binding beta-propeller fold protein YncE
MKKKILIVLGAALAAGALAAAPAAGAAEPLTHPFLFSLGKFPPPPPNQPPVPPPEAEFEDACGVAVDSFGDIYLSDYYHHVIDVFSPSQDYLAQIADPDPDGPCNLAVDSAGRLYVNHWRRNVARLTPSSYPPGESTTYGSETVIDSARSTGVAIDPATGNVYVDDRTYVAEYEPSGEPILKEGLPLRIAPDPQASYYGVAVSGFPQTQGYLYLPDAATGTVKVYDPETSLTAPVQAIDGAGAPRQGFVSLVDSSVAIDQTDGHIFVADNTEAGFEHPSAVIDEFNPKGAYRGGLPKAMIDAEPSALAVDGAGNAYATSGNDEEALLLAFGPTFPGHGLEVTKSGPGEGTLTSEPAGIECGGACAAEFNAGEEVTLTAVPAPGSEFVGWSGCEHPSAQRCTLAMGADREVGAEFEEAAVPLGAQAPLAESAAPGPAALIPGAASLGAPAPGSARPARQHRRRHRHRKGHSPKKERGR